jgi:hypothetical protein
VGWHRKEIAAATNDIGSNNLAIHAVRGVQSVTTGILFLKDKTPPFWKLFNKKKTQNYEYRNQ